MNLSKTLLFAVFSAILVFSSCKPKEQTKYPYESVHNDPLNARIYTLKNGLKVYLTVNSREPRIQTYIAVRAGSKFDPKETTGLAHYLEHMMFKGTQDFGTLDWEKEKIMLDTISALYELHKNTADPEQKKKIYHRIDSISYEASKLAVPNEYDKMMTSLGAKGTNAYTWVEQTVYVNDIPSNELEKWLYLESNRFRTLVLRLFHTELETVYEEFNRAQDNDYRKSWDAVQNGLYPSHPYGTQTTLGEGEHLKNPSMVNIHRYFDRYYVPNNIAICLSGELDPDKTIALIDKYFGGWQPKEVPPVI
ncbi:MAG TPA: insulinase family protein, partial [Chitinophagales bacterium]|nr:insulinase family protein [Chitinophagales bacterium]